MPPVKPVIQICVTESLSRLWGKSAIWSIMTIMRQRWTHQFHSPKYYALLMDNSRSPLFRDSVFLPPSFHPLLTSPPLHKCFRHPLTLSQNTLWKRDKKDPRNTEDHSNRGNRWIHLQPIWLQSWQNDCVLYLCGLFASTLFLVHHNKSF